MATPPRPTVPTLPPAPDVQDQATFNDRANVFVPQLPPFGVALNDLGDWMGNRADDVAQAQEDTESARDAAEGFRNSAEGFRDAAEGFRDNAETFRDHAEGFRDGAEAFRNQAEGFAGDAEQSAEDAQNAAAGVQFPVSYEPQSLTSEQQEQARTNIASVAYEGQSLTFDQRAVARSNISAANVPNLEVIAHRGFRNPYVQNTLPALTACLTGGADSVEFDIFVSSDGEPVVFHDTNVDSLTNGTGDIRTLTAAQIADLRYTKADGTQLEGVGIPTLEDVMLALRGRRLSRIYPELKGSTDTAYIETAAEAVKSYNLSDRTTWQSFNYSDLAVIRGVDALCELGFIVPNGASLEDLEGHVDTLAGDFTNCALLSHFNNIINHPSIVGYAREAGVGLGVWTVNDIVDFREMMRLGVTRIMTDFNFSRSV